MILDTNALSAMAGGDPGLERALARTSELSLPAVVLGEYLFGVRQSRARARYEAWLAQVVPLCRLLPVDEHTADQYAELRRELKTSGRPIPPNDIWIGALARQYRLPVVSRDQHFDFVQGLVRIAW